jgi:hypothetical protein
LGDEAFRLAGLPADAYQNGDFEFMSFVGCKR